MKSDRNGSREEDSTDGDNGDQRDTTRREFLAGAIVAGLSVGFAGGLGGATSTVRTTPLGSGGDPSRDSPDPSTGPVAASSNDTAEGDWDQAAVERAVSQAGTSVLGANLNGRPHRLGDNFELLDASETTWVRAFLDVRAKLADETPPEDDPDVVALRRAARELNCKLIVSLKWDFKANWGDKEPASVPPSGSEAERNLCQCAVRYLRSIGAPVDVVVLGNEPMWETLDDDIKVDDPPVVRFTRTAKAHLVEDGDHGDPTYLVGAFNRAHHDGTRTREFPQFYRGMFDFVRADEDVDGIDLHVHYGSFAQAEKTVAVARRALPEATITATEFSPVWRYKRHVGTPITEFEAGEQFASEYDLSGGTTAVDYFEYAKRNPRPPAELADFYDAMPWYNVDHLAEVHDLFSRYGVSVGTLGFLQSLDMRNADWTGDWPPFHINFLYQPALTRTDDGVQSTAHPQYLEDYRERTG